MSYIKKEPLLQIAKELQGKVFGAPLIVRAIEEAPEEDVVEVRQVNNFIRRLRDIPGAIYHSELKQVCKEFGFDYLGRKIGEEEDKYI